MNLDTNANAADPRWVGLYKTGACAGILMLVIMAVQIFIYIVWPPPSTVVESFQLLNENWLLGLFSLDLLYILNNTLLIPIYLSIYVLIRRFDESSALLALVFGLVGISAYFASNVSFEMLSLSSRYVAAGSEAQKLMYLAAGQSMLETYKGTAFDVYYVLNAVSLLIFAYQMLRSRIFSREIGLFGLIAGILMAVPSTAGTLGLFFSLFSLIPWSVFVVLLARRLLQLTAVLTRLPVSVAAGNS